MSDDNTQQDNNEQEQQVSERIVTIHQTGYYPDVAGLVQAGSSIVYRGETGHVLRVLPPTQETPVEPSQEQQEALSHEDEPTEHEGMQSETVQKDTQSVEAPKPITYGG